MPQTPVQLHTEARELPHQPEVDGAPAPVMLPEFMYPLFMLSAGMWVTTLLKRHYVAAKARIRSRATSARLDDGAGNA
jgi:hypothetical protein